MSHAVSPVKVKPIYMQPSDGDKSMLMQDWWVSVLNSISSTSERQAPYQCAALYEADGISNHTWYPMVFFARRAASRSPSRGHVVSRFIPVVSMCLTSFTKSPTSPPMLLVIILDSICHCIDSAPRCIAFTAACRCERPSHVFLFLHPSQTLIRLLLPPRARVLPCHPCRSRSPTATPTHTNLACRFPLQVRYL
jgi:hypothetical protein